MASKATPEVKFPPSWGQEANSIIDSVSEHSAREVALVAHAFLDKNLEDVIALQFKAEKPDSRIFTAGGSFNSFISKVHFVHAMGWISSDFRTDLCRINDIRNHFAHSVKAIDFETEGLVPDIPASCRDLKLPEDHRAMLQWTSKVVYGTETISSETTGLEEGVYLVDQVGFVGAIAKVPQKPPTDNKGRFIMAVKLASLILRAACLSFVVRE